MPHQAVSVLDGNTFVVSDRHGDVQPDSRLPPHGFFAQDTRFVSRWRLTVQGRPTDVRGDDTSARIDGAPSAAAGSRSPRPQRTATTRITPPPVEPSAVGRPSG